MNILVTHKAVDVATYKMLGELSKNESYTIYLTVPSASEAAKVEGKCIPLPISPITSKFSWKVIKTLRRYVKQYDIDLIFSPSTSGLSNALIATIGTSVKNVGYRGTQAKVKKLDPTYYMGILNPRVDHIVCETADIQEYLTRYIDKDKLSVSVKPFDIDWVADACANPKQAEGVPDNAFKCIYIGTTKGRPFKGLTYLIKAFQILNAPEAHLVVIGDYDNSDYELAQQGWEQNVFISYGIAKMRFLFCLNRIYLSYRLCVTPLLVLSEKQWHAEYRALSLIYPVLAI
ncbi:hypothetical protein KUBF_07230 [Bacteroides finegoldii]|nr:hypothetical protein KUBF_07230 [Bacteroides finegoldii]